MTAGQLREAAKAAARATRKAQREHEAKQPKVTITWKVGPTGYGKAGSLFQAFIDLAAKHGWTSGYNAPESQAFLFDTFALLKQMDWRSLQREMMPYQDYGFRGGLADFVGGAYMRMGNEEQFQMAFQANQAGMPIVISRV
jgi:hypothetical protein